MTEPILEVDGLTKSFGALRATDGVSLAVYPQQIHAQIGPNGAGKTTLLAQIAGELAPDAGSIRFLGRDIGALSVAQACAHGPGADLPDLLAGARLLGAAQRDAGGAGDSRARAFASSRRCAPTGA